VLRVENVGQIKPFSFYLDSGSFDNLVGDQKNIFNYNALPGEVIECAGDQILHTKGEGTVHLDSLKHNGLSEIKVKYVPGLNSNLLSVSAIAKSNLVTVFTDNYGGVFRKEDITIKGKPILKAIESNGTYKVNLEAFQNHAALKASLNSEHSKWHKRLGHIGKNGLSILKGGLVDGIPQKVTYGTDPCHTCLESKQTRAPLPNSGAKRATKLLEIIHSDVCEVTDTLSWEGYRYFLTFIDDKTRYTMIALLKSKAEVFEKFRSYQTMVERYTENKIKIVRSDNGTEYCNEKFDNHFKKEGILKQLSVVDTPEQNGVAERANRTLLETARSLLKESGLDNKYWAEALEMAVYLKNICPTKSVEGMVPFQAWAGSKPNVEGLRIFGCLASVHVSRKKTKKLGNRSRDCIFMGYDEEKKGFRLLDLNQPRKIFVERSVVFNEERFPAKELKSEKEKIKISSKNDNSDVQTSHFTELVVT